MDIREQYTPASEFELEADGQNYIIKKYTGSRSVVSIPPMINGRKVVKIGNYAFVEEIKVGFLKFEYHSIVQKVIIPETVTEIYGFAFFKCNTLKTVNLHPGITRIGSSAFFGCDQLELLDFGIGDVVQGMVKLPKGLKELGDTSLNRSNGACIFKEVLMSKRTKWKKSTFGNSQDAFNAETCAVFYYEDGIPKMDFAAVTSVMPQQYTPESEFELVSDGENYAIKKYTGDRKVVSIPPMIRGRKVVAILGAAFCTEEKISFWKSEYYSTVEKVIIPETVTKINGAFFHCRELHTVIAHPGIEEIGSYSFVGCNNLNILDFGMGEVVPGMVKFPKGLKKLGESSLKKSNGDCYEGCLFKEVIMSRKTKWTFNYLGSLSYAFEPGACAVFYYEDGVPGENLHIYESTDSQLYTPESEFELVSEGVNYAIKRYTGNRSVVSVPPVIRGRKVVKLGDLSFARGEKVGFMNIQDVSTVEKVIIPETVTEIGTRAFYCCGKLHTVIAHPGITIIDNLAFAYCISLKKLAFDMGEQYPGTLNLPKGLKKLGDHSLVADLLSNKCLFGEVVVRRGLKIKDAFNMETCRVFYYED